MSISGTPVIHRTALRHELRSRRCSLTPFEQREASRKLQRRLISHPWFHRARSLALYLANDGEIDPQPVLEEALRRKKQVYLPVLARWPERHMVFQRVCGATRWQVNRFGIREPVWDDRWQRPLWALDLLCLPLVGFDAAGGRLGMGGGFYDRSLAACRLPLPPVLGLAHACQQVEGLPLEPWDMPLDAVVTDQAWHDCAAQAGN